MLRQRFTCAAGVLLTATLLAACAGDPGSRIDEGTPIVIISIDTLRSDRLPMYGYAGVDTPALDRLRGDSILFEHAYAPIPLTFPAHASLLTGQLPPRHGVRDNVGYRLETEGRPYLPTLLRDRGYATGAAVSSFVLRSNSGLDAGFDFYDDLIDFEGLTTEMGSVQRPGDETLERTRPWLEEAAAGPFFLFFHIYEPHTPFAPPEPFASRYPSAYDGEVAASDWIIGDLLDDLRRLGVYDDAVIVLTSDHGEGLGEHGYYEHGPFLYREAIQVPLLLKLPQGERGGESVERAAQLTDVLPTLLELLGEPPRDDVDGDSLLGLVTADGAERRLYGETFFPRLHFGWSDLASIIEYPWHYIHGPDPELFNLETDPGELVNLFGEERRISTELRRELDRYDRELTAPDEVDAETRQRLAALGYVGTVGGDTDGPLPDPKSRVHTLESMRQAFIAFYEGRYAESVPMFESVLVSEPGMIDGWESLGHALMRLDRPAEAWEAYRRAVELSGGSAHVALPAASALLRLGRLDEARSHAELAAAGIDAAQDILAQIAVRQGRFEDAETHLERAIATRGTRVGPLITRAELLLRQKRYAEAVEASERAEAALPAGSAPEVLRGLFYTRGSAAARLGEAAAAERAFQREIELTPDALPAYAELAFLYALQGNGAAAGATLRALVETNPIPAAYATAVRTLRQMGDEGSARRVLAQARSRWPQAPELQSIDR